MLPELSRKCARGPQRFSILFKRECISEHKCVCVCVCVCQCELPPQRCDTVSMSNHQLDAFQARHWHTDRERGLSPPRTRRRWKNPADSFMNFPLFSCDSLPPLPRRPTHKRATSSGIIIIFSGFSDDSVNAKHSCRKEKEKTRLKWCCAKHHTCPDDQRCWVLTCEAQSLSCELRAQSYL